MLTQFKVLTIYFFGWVIAIVSFLLLSGCSNPPTSSGEKLFNANGCLNCHSTEGHILSKIGPSLKGIYGKTVELNDGTTTLVDDNYIKESIVDSYKKIVKGYPAAMPSYKGFTEAELNNLVSYIKELK